MQTDILTLLGTVVPIFSALLGVLTLILVLFTYGPNRWGRERKKTPQVTGRWTTVTEGRTEDGKIILIMKVQYENCTKEREIAIPFSKVEEILREETGKANSNHRRKHYVLSTTGQIRRIDDVVEDPSACRTSTAEELDTFLDRLGIWVQHIGDKTTMPQNGGSENTRRGGGKYAEVPN